MAEASIKLLLVDDHALILEGLRAVFETVPHMEVVGEAGGVAEAVAEARRCLPDVIILDMWLPDGNGIEVCREIRSRFPETSCLVLTSYADDRAMFEAVIAGAAGYVLKETRASELVDDIRKLAAGESLLDESVTQRVLASMRSAEEHRAPLSPQEERILDLIGEGLSNREIAQRLHLAEQTVKNYVSRLMAKLGFERRVQAALYATQRVR